MASIKVKFRPSTIEGQKGTVFYQIIHERRVCRVSSQIHISAWQWDFKRSRINQYSPGLECQRRRVRLDIELLTRVIGNLERRQGLFEAEDVVEGFLKVRQRLSIVSHMESLAASLTECGRLRTAETYRSTLSRFIAFNGGNDVMIDTIDAEMISRFESWLKQHGNTPNTTSFYMRVMRAAYNRAVNADLIVQTKPFRHVYTGIAKTVKRALPLKILKKIKSFAIDDQKISYARDIFLLSFYLRGMSFIDMAFLKKTDLRQGYIIYRRRKTGRLLKIEWTKEMQEIVDRHQSAPSIYLLPILTDNVTDERNAYLNAMSRVNRHLKSLARILDIDFPITLYCARHSWATTARGKGVPTSVISQGMGHDSEYMTQIYLASLDTSVVDRANKRVINSVL